MILGHSIALDVTDAQAVHLRRACGVARFAWNWGLAEWNRMHAAGEKPSSHKIKTKWNAVRRVEFPWSLEVTKCASAQAILDLGTAFTNFFRDIKKAKGARKSHFPRFKSKRNYNSFALWNDQFVILDNRIRIPRLGWVKMHEKLRFSGKILGARVRRIGTRWHVSVQVETKVELPIAPIPIVGIDLGISVLMTLSRPLPDGRTKIENPNARRKWTRRVRKLSRRISRQELARRARAAETSNRQRRRYDALRKLHSHIASIRKDAIHKATSIITENFSTIALEDLNVSGMAKNHRLSGSILDAAFAEVRRQFEYKTTMRGGCIVIIDRFFPSSKTCSACSHVLEELPLHKRKWTCPKCEAHHDRDDNAARNIELVGAASPKPSANDRSDTRGEIRALVASQDATKLRSLNRELQQARLRTFAK